MTPCTCTPADRATGHYAPTCVPHAPYRCTVRGCADVAVDRHLCAAHGKRWWA